MDEYRAVKKCETCGEEFVGHKNSVYCQACRLERERELRRMRKKHHKEAGVQPEEKESVNRPMTSVEISVAARIANMTYGQYVARYGV